MRDVFAYPRRIPPGHKLPPDRALEIVEAYSGMTLRDYFAAAAMTRLRQLYFADGSEHPPDVRAKWTGAEARTAYAYADAMLAERERSKP